MKAFPLLAILSTVICVSVSASATTFYVDGSVPSSGDGTSWETALKTIQEGIIVSSDGETVIVAEGVYIENIHFKGKNLLLRSTDPLDPQVLAATVIDGNQAGPVVTFAGTEMESCVLSGFTIRNGSGWLGGGISGASWFGSTRATIENSAITGNSAGNRGGGVHGCDGTIQNNTIAGNSAGGVGGGLSVCGGMVRNNTITGNSAGSGGAGLFDCDGTIQNNKVAGNSTEGEGGGGGLYQCDGTIQNNRIAGNWAKDGGGLCSCNGTIQNCIISGNCASQDGGGLHECRGSVGNCTITGNSAKDVAGGLYAWSGAVVNSIIWGNRARQFPQLLLPTAAPTYSCIQDWTSGGEGNVADIPRFLRSAYWDDPGTPYDPDDDVWVEGDYHVLPDSPCIDAGKNQDWMWDAVDLDGNPRLYPGVSPWAVDFVDMGAYEYVPSLFEYMSSVRTAGDAIQVIWTSESGRAYKISSCVDLSAGLWADEETVPCQGVITRWTDTQPPGRMKFYRIEMQSRGTKRWQS